ncbi:MAG: hypothetical protein ABI543_00080 [Ignavibacteria bacterium]
MLNAVKSAIGRKLLTALLLAFLLFTSFLFSQNTFRLGFTGAYPNYSHILLNSPTYNSDWNWYDEFTMNTWSAWWA